MNLLAVYSLFDVTPVKAEGVFVYDEQGTKYLDLYGGHAVISIGHTHPHYVQQLTAQLQQLAFYSNSIRNPLQERLADRLTTASGCDQYRLFLCNSGAEANENALKLASFHTGKKKIVAFDNAFHGRTSAAVAATDNPGIVAPLNGQHQVERISLGDLKSVENALKTGDVCAVIVECIQGIGGLNESSTAFYKGLDTICRAYEVVLIADEIQSGFGRTGDFFSFQKHGITPGIISMAKGMGNGFPVGGILVHPGIEASLGMLGTTFGGNHLACTAALSVLEVLENEHIREQVAITSHYFMERAKDISEVIAIKGRGLMLGLEFGFPVAELRRQLLYKHHIFTGSSANPNLLRILPPLTIQKTQFDIFFNALQLEL